MRKCPYCDFNSHEDDAPPVSAYVDALVRDFEREVKNEHRTTLESIFIGGGTPSLVPPDEIARLFEVVRQQFSLDGVEVTIEANPGTFDLSHFSGYRTIGINRISLGAQSFDDTALAALGRIHGAADVYGAFAGAREAGFERINLDLMHGLPGQTRDTAMRDLQEAVTLAPEHLSWYQLTIEPNTRFYKQPPVLPADSVLESIHESGSRVLQSAGYAQYEVSAYARHGDVARHNLNYWQFGDYIGIGAGAHGKLTRGDTIVRTTKTRLPRDYLEGIDPRRAQEVSPHARPLEFLMNALRLNEGFTWELFESRTRLERDALARFIGNAAGRGLIETDATGVRATPKGHLFLDDLLMLVDT